MSRSAKAFAVLFALVLMSSASAKSVIVKIVVQGDALTEPLIITDEHVIEQFSIWSGPNSRSRRKGEAWEIDYSGAFIDFSAGMADSRPSGLTQFEVEFHLAESRIGAYLDETYDVRYAMNPAKPGGYFYLPIGNPYIYHGVEGNWLHSTEHWEELLRPAIQDRLGRTVVRDANTAFHVASIAVFRLVDPGLR